jgi:hypothetical protein
MSYETDAGRGRSGGQLLQDYPVMTPTVRTSRRAFLLGSVALVGGCTTHDSGNPDRPSASPTTSATQLTARTRLAAENRLVTTYEQSLRAHPGLARILRPIHTDHVAHVAALRPIAAGQVPAEVIPRIPASMAGTLKLLCEVEAQAVQAGQTACLAAESSLAALLGSISASERSHLVPLGTPPAPRPPGAVTGSADIGGLQQALAAQNEVRWGYDVVGGQVSAAAQPLVRSAQARHVAIQSVLQAALYARHATPTPGAAGYSLPFPVSGQRAAFHLAATLEDRSGACWHYLLELPGGRAVRELAVTMLGNAATQATIWRGKYETPATVALPGT